VPPRQQYSEVRVDLLVEDYAIYPRAMVQDLLVRQYAADWAEGAEIPPVVADRATFRIVDGVHRVRAAKRLKRATVPTILRTYASEQEMFLDAARLNWPHGRGLTPWERRKAVLRLLESGMTPAQIQSALHVSLRFVEQTVASRVSTPEGETVPKAVVRSWAGGTWTQSQVEAHRHLGGWSWTYYARQLRYGITTGLMRVTDQLVEELDGLVADWQTHRDALIEAAKQVS
jgi:hypothetical protein